MTYDVDPPRHLPDVPMKAPDEPPGFFDKPQNVKRLKLLAWIFVLGLFVADFFLHYHEYVGLERIPGYYTIFGFVASIVLIVASKLGGRGLKREEDYYV